MGKIIIKNRRNETIFINKISYPEDVNERVFGDISRGMYEDLLSLSIKRKRKEAELICDVVNLCPAVKFFEGHVNKQVFLGFVYQLIDIIKTCEKKGLSSNNLNLKLDRIFINTLTNKVKCIYWPVVNNELSTQPSVFFRELPYNLGFNSIYEDTDYVEKYSLFFEQNTIFSLIDFEKFIVGLIQGKPSRSSVEKQPYKPGNDPAPIKDNESKEKPPRGYDPFSISQQKKTEFDNPRTELITGENTVTNAILRCLSQQADIPITGKELWIGKDPNQCGYATVWNKHVSRRHAAIRYINGKYCIMDDNSTNGTFLNGRKIPSSRNFVLKDGYRIKLGDEEFIFYLQ